MIKSFVKSVFIKRYKFADDETLESKIELAMGNEEFMSHIQTYIQDDFLNYLVETDCAGDYRPRPARYYGFK
jgi:hypothetical protein